MRFSYGLQRGKHLLPWVSEYHSNSSTNKRQTQRSIKVQDVYRTTTTYSKNNCVSSATPDNLRPTQRAGKVEQVRYIKRDFHAHRSACTSKSFCLFVYRLLCLILRPLSASLVFFFLFSILEFFEHALLLYYHTVRLIVVSDTCTCTTLLLSFEIKGWIAATSDLSILYWHVVVWKNGIVASQIK